MHLPQILMGASSSRSTGCWIKISLALMHSHRISVSVRFTCRPGRAPLTLSSCSMILSTSISFMSAMVSLGVTVNYSTGESASTLRAAAQKIRTFNLSPRLALLLGPVHLPYTNVGVKLPIKSLDDQIDLRLLCSDFGSTSRPTSRPHSWVCVRTLCKVG
jgi:hypothetical protein